MYNYAKKIKKTNSAVPGPALRACPLAQARHGDRAGAPCDRAGAGLVPCFGVPGHGLSGGPARFLHVYT